MKRSAAWLALVVLAACSPQPSASGPEAMVAAIYEPLVKSKGQKATLIAAVPMTADLKDLVSRAEATADDTMPVFDGDVAGNCQDCAGFTDLKIAPAADDTSGADSRKVIEATFTIQDGQRTVYWDMVQTPQGWRVDNIMSEGFNLRSIANTVIAQTPRPEGDEAVECLGYLALEIEILRKAKPPGDTAPFEAAYIAWRKKAEGLFTPEALKPYFNSVVAVVGSVPAKQRGAKISTCTTNAPAQ